MTTNPRFVDRLRRYVLVVPILLVAACAGTAEQRLLTACAAHDAADRALIPLIASSMLSQAQVDASEASVAVADTICSGEFQDFSTALDTLEAELLRLSIMRETSQ